VGVMAPVKPARQGLNGAAHARMDEVQRARMLAGAVEVVSERGYAGMSVARVTARAGVSRRTFYDLFDGREDCFLGVFERAVDRASARASEAYGQAGSWREKVRAGLSAVLQFLGDDPGLGMLLVVDALGAGSRVLEVRARGLETLTRIIDQGRGEVKSGPGPPPLTAEGLVGAVLGVLHARMLEPDAPPPIELLNPLMAMIVLPYLGRAAAAKELARPVAALRASERPPIRDPLEGLGIRITYRTLRVLAVIAEHPGSSNREVANLAEISDQGQISKLLTRLTRLGLVENAGLGHAKGEANAWALTAKGEETQRAIEAQAQN
jgi:AcrR family transcriptional regulator/DNA-binding MarR family transcriptional regulator